MTGIFLLMAILFVNLHPGPAFAAKDVFQKYNKVIWIDQGKQVGAAYGRGRMLMEFPIMSGDDETPTPPGTYVIKTKVRHHHSRKYNQPMPYSLFFDYRGRAIHEGDVAKPEERSEWATHGCIHVEQPFMKWLYDWAETGKTVVLVRGRRVWEDEEPQEDEVGKADEESQEREESENGEDNED